MLIGFDTRPGSLSLRDRSIFNYEMTSKYIALKNVFIQKSIFVDFFFSFNPNSYGNQRRLCSGNLPGMFEIVNQNFSKTADTLV